MWGENDVSQSQGDIWLCPEGLVEDHKQSWSCHPPNSGLLEDHKQSWSCHPPNSGLLPPDDELPVDVKQEECTEDSMVTDLLLDSDTSIEDPSLEFPDRSGSQKLTAESTNDVTKGNR